MAHASHASLIVLWSLAAALLAGCASSRGAQSRDEQLARLEAENQRLRGELSQKQKAAQDAHAAASRAESAKGLANASCSAVSPARGSPAPRSGAVHAKLQLGASRFLLIPRFDAGRSAGPVKVAQGRCEVSRR